MSRLVIFANQSAGSGRATHWIRQARRSFWGWPVEVRPIPLPDQFAEECRNLDPATVEGVILIGGDGTLNYALAGLAHRGIPVLPFPGGTANDLANELGISPDWNQIQQLIDKKQTDLIDLIEVNGHYVATQAGVGVGARLTGQFNQWRARSTMFRKLIYPLRNQVYTALSVKTILLDTGYTHRLRFHSHSFQGEVKVASLFVCNQAKLGGDLTIANRAKNNDGQFNVMALTRPMAPDLLNSLIHLKRGVIPKDSIVFRSDHLIIEDLDRKEIPVFGDGEILTKNKRLDFRIRPKVLRVYRPPVRSGEELP